MFSCKRDTTRFDQTLEVGFCCRTPTKGGRVDQAGPQEPLGHSRAHQYQASLQRTLSTQTLCAWWVVLGWLTVCVSACVEIRCSGPGTGIKARQRSRRAFPYSSAVLHTKQSKASSGAGTKTPAPASKYQVHQTSPKQYHQHPQNQAEYKKRTQTTLQLTACALPKRSRPRPLYQHQ